MKHVISLPPSLPLSPAPSLPLSLTPSSLPLPPVSLLSTEGEYAGNDVIVAFTRAFSTHVVIHQLNTPRWEILAPPTATPTSSERPTLHIAYLNGDHYCSVQPIHPQHSRPSATSQPQTVRVDCAVHTPFRNCTNINIGYNELHVQVQSLME